MEILGYKIMKIIGEQKSKLKPKNNILPKQKDNVNHPGHYTDGGIEVIDFIEAKKLGYCLGNVVKYVSRCGKKESAGRTKLEKEIEDLKKAEWYLNRRIKELEEDMDV